MNDWGIYETWEIDEGKINKPSLLMIPTCSLKQLSFYSYSRSMAAFSLNLLNKIQLGLIASGKFDGSHSCLAAATPGGKVIIHSPHKKSIDSVDFKNSVSRLSWSGEIAELRVEKEVTALTTGRFGENEKDILLIGTNTHVLAYQVDDNTDVFYKEMKDGVNCITVGRLGWLKNKVTIIGGNSSVTILDYQGNKVYWTVTSGNVRDVIAFDTDGDTENELIIGTDNCEIKAQKEDLVVWQLKESSAINVLTPLNDKKFAYAIANGTLGVYENGVRIWRVKSKHKVTSAIKFDINGDGNPELITGWSNGRVDARVCDTGENLFRVQLNSPIAGIVEADYRGTGEIDLVIVSQIGEVRGYAVGSANDIAESNEIYGQLLSRKYNLEAQIKQRIASASNYFFGSKLAVSLSTTREAVCLTLASGPGLLIFCAIVFAEGIFKGETFVAHPKKPKEELEIELRPDKNETVDIQVKTCIGTSSSDLLQVFEIMQQLPPFCMYEIIDRANVKSEKFENHGITIETGDRPQRIALWLNQNFSVSEELEISMKDAEKLDLYLRGLRDDALHYLSVNPSGRLILQTEDHIFAGDIVQSLTKYLGILELNAVADFPAEEKRMIDALERVKEFEAIEIKLQAEVAGVMSIMKTLMICLEDSRILDDGKSMKQKVMQIQTLGENSISEQEIRRKNYREFTCTLKELNSGMVNASRIRVGKSATRCVERCKMAIKDGDPKALIQALRNG